MGKGLFDNIPVTNRARDKAWEAFIKRKDVKGMFGDPDFNFPLECGWYELWCLWCQAWEPGWQDGFKSAYEKEERMSIEAIANWMMKKGYATGHGDTVEDLLTELEWQAKEREREWVGLTDDEIREIVGSYAEVPIKGYTRELFNKIEAKLKEKNT